MLLDDERRRCRPHRDVVNAIRTRSRRNVAAGLKQTFATYASVVRDVKSKKLGDIVVEERDDGVYAQMDIGPRTASCSRGRCFQVWWPATGPGYASGRALLMRRPALTSFGGLPFRSPASDRRHPVPFSDFPQSRRFTDDLPSAVCVKRRVSAGDSTGARCREPLRSIALS